VWEKAIENKMHDLEIKMKLRIIVRCTTMMVMLLTSYSYAEQKPPLPATTPEASESINWQVISTGGAINMASANYRLSGTTGQTAVGRTSPSGFRCNSGFWQVLYPGGCCLGRVGDANGEGEYPDEVTLGDIMLLVDVKFISGNCGLIPCIAEADVNQDGGSSPSCDDHVTLGDIMTLVDFLFITGQENATLPECL